MANPGKMNRRITVQQRTFSKGSAGGRVDTWADAFDVWAELVTARTNEAIIANAERERDVKRFRVRYREAFNTGDFRILYRMRFYDLEGIEEEGLKDRMLLTCKSVQAS
jgi:SPP1 family predicted phage head-tail adaptor